MNTVEKVSESLKQNSSIDNIQVKEYIESLVVVFNKAFPSISLDNLSNLLKNVKIDSGSKFFYKEPTQYDVLNNMIIINIESLQKEGTDVKHSMMKTLLSMITCKDNSYGFGINSSLEALNIGFREILANNLVGNEGISEYEDEQILTNILGFSIDVDTFTNAFFTNNPDLVMRGLLTKCQDIKKLESILSQMNNNMHTRNQTGKSNLYDIQKQVLIIYETRYDFLIDQEAMENNSNIKYPNSEQLKELQVRPNAKVI